MIDKARLLASLPEGLRDPLIASYREIAANYVERRWEPAELNGGKLCEVVYSVIDGAISGSFPTAPTKPAQFANACRGLEQKPADPSRVGDRSLRVLIPRVLIPLYEIRSNRGVGHVGGDVDPNLMDATAVLGMASWVLAELVRVFHGVSTEEAQVSVNAIIERKHPLIWEVGDVKRVLDPSMKAQPQVLVLLCQHPGWVKDTDLFRWTEYSNLSVFRGNVLGKLHEKRLIEFDVQGGQAQISPLGIDEVETRLLKTR